VAAPAIKEKPELLVRLVGVSQNADRALEAWAGRLAGTAANYGELHGTASGDSFRAEKPRLWAEGFIGPQTGQRSFDLT